MISNYHEKHFELFYSSKGHKEYLFHLLNIVKSYSVLNIDKFLSNDVIFDLLLSHIHIHLNVVIYLQLKHYYSIFDNLLYNSYYLINQMNIAVFLILIQLLIKTLLSYLSIFLSNFHHYELLFSK